ncbi:farnesol dehydrogenase-like [Polistes fuscatus]|uniref:farnesol dehydrogenase-like n=1 Tax=Polistes fuscatus TaxID=30207 RepID=UPI001CA89034|nr:farnesol dehydrogenase-like [Polistes fuscatus]
MSLTFVSDSTDKSSLNEIIKICPLDSSRSDWNKLFDVNVLGVIDCTKRAARMMLDANVEGCIININSVAGHDVVSFPGISLNMYPATKFAVRAASEITAKELHDSKIRVTSVSPGLVATDIMAASNFEIQDVPKHFPVLKPSDIADAVIYIIGTPQRVHITELIIRPLGELKYAG